MSYINERHLIPTSWASINGRRMLIWSDVSKILFKEPFFDQSINNLSNESKNAKLTLYPDIFDKENNDDNFEISPSGFIFHVSRCGSTLLSRMLANNNRFWVISEPSCLNRLLSFEDIGKEEKVQHIRSLINALGPRSTRYTHYIIKFTSWNYLFFDLIHQAFPNTPCVFLIRDPSAVIASQKKAPAQWIVDKKNRIFDSIARETEGTSKEFIESVIEFMMEKALVSEKSKIIDYSEFPDSALKKTINTFNLKIDCISFEEMLGMSRFYSKSSTKTLWKNSEKNQENLIAHYNVNRVYQELIKLL